VNLHSKLIIEVTRHDVVSLRQLQRPAPADDAIAPHIVTSIKFLDTIGQAAVSLGDAVRCSFGCCWSGAKSAEIVSLRLFKKRQGHDCAGM
jgi:hypothetical protein